MAKGRNTGLGKLPEPTKLDKSHDVFRAELEEQIQKGEALLGSFKNAADHSRIEADYDGWHNYNLELLKASFNDPWNEYRGQYDNAGEFSGGIHFHRTPDQRIKDFIATFNKKLEKLRHLRDTVHLLKSDSPNNLTTSPPSESAQMNMTQVFIVHGHDEGAKQEVARFIEKLGLTPIILHEQPSSGRTIIEKIEAYSNVGFAVVLYTPCDVGALKGHEDKLRDRARQNVVFEHGYLIGKIGRMNVCALVKGDVETPGDITGVVYVSMQSEWRLTLAKELKSSGYNVDMNKALD